MIKAVIFDHGGVMCESRTMSMEVAEIFDIPLEEVQEAKPTTLPLFHLLQKSLISEEDFWKEISIIFKKPLLKDYKKIPREVCKKHLVLIPKMFELVKELNKKKFKTVVLSNIAKYAADPIWKAKGYKPFKFVFLSYEEKLEKPDLAIYISTIKKIKVKPEECIFIDDKERNLIPARELGIHTVLAENPDQIIKDVNFIIENEKAI